MSGAVPLVTTVAAGGVTCSFPSLDGPEITLQVATADRTMGGFITLTSSKVKVRIGAGSGTSYTERDFQGTGVTGFDATKGAQFNAQLTDSTPAGQKTGTIGAVTSVSGSVTCGDKTPGSGTISITGDSTGGTISGQLTSLLVNCTGTNFALINGLTTVGVAPATVEVGGGGSEVTFASLSTASAGFFFSSSKPDLYTVSNGHVHWNAGAVLMQTGAPETVAHTVTVTGDATCGT